MQCAALLPDDLGGESGTQYLDILLRVLQAALPLIMLYVGKEIIDQVVGMAGKPAAQTLPWTQWPVWFWVLLELGLVIFSTLLGRAITLIDSLLGDLVNNNSSVRIIRHAATLDLYQFEDPTFYDKLERARTQTAGRTALMSMVLSQAQDILSVMLLAGGLIANNPWLILILVLVIPTFIGKRNSTKRVIHSRAPGRPSAANWIT